MTKTKILIIVLIVVGCCIVALGLAIGIYKFVQHRKRSSAVRGGDMLNAEHTDDEVLAYESGMSLANDLEEALNTLKSRSEVIYLGTNRPYFNPDIIDSIENCLNRTLYFSNTTKEDVKRLYICAQDVVDTAIGKLAEGITPYHVVRPIYGYHTQIHNPYTVSQNLYAAINKVKSWVPPPELME